MEIDRLVERYNEFNGPVEILRNEDVSGCPAIFALVYLSLLHA